MSSSDLGLNSFLFNSVAKGWISAQAYRQRGTIRTERFRSHLGSTLMKYEQPSSERVGGDAPAAHSQAWAKQGSMKHQDSKCLSENTVTMVHIWSSITLSFCCVSEPFSALSLTFLASAPPLQSFSACCYANGSPSFAKISWVKVLHIPHVPV